MGRVPWFCAQQHHKVRLPDLFAKQAALLHRKTKNNAASFSKEAKEGIDLANFDDHLPLAV
jgi:hypothetical protein